MRMLVLGVLVACDAGPPVAAAPTPAKPAVAPVAKAPVPQPAQVTPPKMPEEVELDKLTTTSRVMATADGSAVLLQIVDRDGARGEPNLAFEVRDRKDRATRSVAVMKLDEDAIAATLAPRVAEANKLIASQPFVAVPELPKIETPEDLAMTRRYGDARLDVKLSGGRLIVELDHERVVDRRIPASWRGKTYHLQGEDIECANPEYLGGVYAAPAAKLVVVDITYRGNDTCWEPTDQLHVIAW
jgi:hypothetical protein